MFFAITKDSLKCYGGKYNEKKLWCKGNLLPHAGIYYQHLYNADGTPNAMNAAWGGIHDTNQVGVCIDVGHKTSRNILVRKCFTVNVGDAAHVVACDYVGIVSGNNDAGKFEKSGFHAVMSEVVDAPVIEELPLCLECRLVSHDPSSGYTVGEIVNVSAPERVLDENGNIDPAKVEAITFDPVHHKYLKLGEVAGTAFKDGNALK